MLRFKKDDGNNYPDWEKKSFADIGSVSMCKRVFKGQTAPVGDVPFFKIGTFGNEPDAFISYELFSELKEKYSYPSKGTILLSASGTLGRTVVFDGNDAYFQDSNIIWLEHDDSILDEFLQYLYVVVHWQEPEGGTIKRLYNKNFLETSFKSPCIEEQQKIADCLSSVDAVIADYEAQVENMQNQKKGVMQKLFSQEVRFKADDGSEYPEWKTVKLQDLGKFTSGVGFSEKYQGHQGLPIKVYKVSDMNLNGNEKFMRVSNNTVDDAILSQMKTKAIKGPAIIFAKVGAAIYKERKRIATETFLIDNNMMAFIPNEGIDLEYLHSLLSSISFSKYAQIGALPSYNASDIGIIKVGLPCLAEQQKIADCLSTFDEAIEDLQKTVEHWKNIKKGLLQQLFA